MKRILILCFIYFLFIEVPVKVCAQVVSQIVDYDSTNSKFTAVDFDGQGNIYFSGYIRPTSSSSQFGNLSYQGYWYEDGLSCKSDASGLLDWMTVSGNSNGLEDSKAIKVFGSSVYTIGKFVSNSTSVFVNQAPYPFPYGCCHGGYVLKQSTAGAFEWIFPLPAYAQDMTVDNVGNCYVVTENQLKKISTLGVEIWNFDIGDLIETKLLLNQDTIYLSATFQSALVLNGNVLEPYGPANDVDGLFARFTSSGNLISVTQIGSPGYDRVHDLTVDQNGQLWISGQCSDSAFFGSQALCDSGNRIYFLRLNSLMQIEHCDIIPFDTIIHWPDISGEMVFVTRNERIAALNISNDLVILGDTLHVTVGGGYEGTSIIIKWDANGNVVWYRHLAESVSIPGNAAWVSAHLGKDMNDNLILAGQMREPCYINGNLYNPEHTYKAFFASLTDTTFSTSIDKNESSIRLQYQNPVTSTTSFHFNEQADAELELYDLSGRKVLFIEKKNCSGIFVDLNSYSNGLYLFHLKIGKKNITGKLIKM